MVGHRAGILRRQNPCRKPHHKRKKVPLFKQSPSRTSDTTATVSLTTPTTRARTVDSKPPTRRSPTPVASGANNDGTRRMPRLRGAWATRENRKTRLSGVRREELNARFKWILSQERDTPQVGVFTLGPRGLDVLIHVCWRGTLPRVHLHTYTHFPSEIGIYT